MKTIATLGPSVRLIVLQFLMWERQVPRVVPLNSGGNSSVVPSPPVRGVEVLPQTLRVYLGNLLTNTYFDQHGQYELVGASRFAPRPDGKCTVTYTFCQREHIKSDELHPIFVAKRDEIMASLINLISNNLWATKGHLNPYSDENGKTGHQVLKFNCAGAESTIDKDGKPNYQYRDGRDEFNRGVGPRIPITEIAKRISVADDKVVLEVPKPTQAQVS